MTMKKLLHIILFPFIFMVNPKIYISEVVDKKNKEAEEKDREEKSKPSQKEVD